jgi:Type II secretion system (T2SS), protein G
MSRKLILVLGVLLGMQYVIWALQNFDEVLAPHLLFVGAVGGGQSRVDRAKMDVKSLETVVTVYLTKHGAYPESLHELTQADPADDSPPPLTERGLLDPWQRPYNYNPLLLHPTNGKPLIWTEGPPGKNMRISNWETDTVPFKK